MKAEGTKPLRKLIFIWSVREKSMLQSTTDDLHITNKSTSVENKQVVNQEIETGNKIALPRFFQPNLVFPATAEDQSKLENIRVNNYMTSADGQQKSQEDSESSDKLNHTRSTISSSNPVHLEFFLTQAKKKTKDHVDTDTAVAAAEDKSEFDSIDPVTHQYITPGRPNLPVLFQQVAELCEKEGISRVAVMTCGPPPMVKEVFGKSVSVL